MNVKKKRNVRSAAGEAAAAENIQNLVAKIHHLETAVKHGLKGRQADEEVDTDDLEEIDISSIPEGMKPAMAKIADGAGAYALAAELRGEELEEGVWTGMKKVGAVNIKVRHVLYAGLIGGALFLVWEGIAYKFDLPRMGVFGGKKR
jgi:hypothetical protein